MTEQWYMYQFPREVRYYQKKLEYIGDNITYLGEIAQPLSNHWKPSIKLVGYSSDDLETDKIYHKFKKPKKALKLSEDKSLQDFKNRIQSTTPSINPTKRLTRSKKIFNTPAPFRKDIKDFSIYTCCYCSIELNKDNYTREHIVPRSSLAFKYASGNDKVKHLTKPCCNICNTEKGSMFLDEYLAFLEKRLKKHIPGSDSHIRTIVKIANVSSFLKPK